MKNDVAVSVILPVYNAKDFVGRAIESILSQDFDSFELILVDDGSTDGSGAICDEYAKKDNRIVLIHQRNSGTCSARNVGLSLARGKYVTFCDHDDECLPRLLRDNFEKAEKENADVVQFGILRIDESNVKMNSLPLIDFSESELRKRYEELRLVPDFIDVWNHFYRRKILKDVCFNPVYRHGMEDKDFNLKVLPNISTKYVFNAKIYYIHYIYSFSSGSTFNTQITPSLIQEYNTIFELEYSFLKDFQLKDFENLHYSDLILLENLLFLSQRINLNDDKGVQEFRKNLLFSNYPLKISKKISFLLWSFKHNIWLFKKMKKLMFSNIECGFEQTALRGFFYDMYLSKRGRWLFDFCNGAIKLMTLPFKLFK